MVYLPKYEVIVCKEHKTGVQNLDTHLRDHHKTPSKHRKNIIARFENLRVKRPGEITLPPLGCGPIVELGEPLFGFRCTEANCGFLTISITGLQIHRNTIHKLPWMKAERRLYYQEVRVQTFFRTGGQERYFIVEAEDAARQQTPQQRGGELDRLMAEWEEKRQAHELQAQVMEAEAAKTDRTGWFHRTGWLTHFAGRNLAHLASAARLPSREEKKLGVATWLVEKLVGKERVRVGHPPH